MAERTTATSGPSVKGIETFSSYEARVNGRNVAGAHASLTAPSSAKKMGPPQRMALGGTPTSFGGARRVPVGGDAKLGEADEDSLCGAMSKGLSLRGDSYGVKGQGLTSQPEAGAQMPEAGAQMPVRQINLDAADTPSRAVKHVQISAGPREFSFQPKAKAPEAAKAPEKQLGTLTILTPVRASKALSDWTGSSQVLTPVRRSARKAGNTKVGDAESLLEITNYSYTPNKALAYDA